MDKSCRILIATTVLVSGEAAENLIKMMNRLDDLDDVQEVITNFEMDEAELDRLSEQE